MIKTRCNMTFFGYVMPLESALHNTNGIISGTTAFLRSRQSKWDTIAFFSHFMPLTLALVSHDTNSMTNDTIAFLRKTRKIRKTEMGWNMTSFVMWCHWHQFLHHMLPLALLSAACDVDSIINETIPFPYSRWLKWGAMWLFFLTWHHWHQHWHHTNSVVNGKIAFFRSRWLKWGATWLICSWDVTGKSIMWWHWCHVRPLSVAVAS